MKRGDPWKLFFETGLPQAYTYAKAKDRRAEQGRGNRPPGEGHRRG